MMGVKVNLHPFFNNGVEMQIEVEGGNTGDCIREVVRLFPEVEKKLFAKPGRLKGYITVFVNARTAYPDELGTPVSNGDTVSILALLAGG